MGRRVWWASRCGCIFWIEVGRYQRTQPPRRRPGPNWKGRSNDSRASLASSPNWAPAFAGVEDGKAISSLFSRQGGSPDWVPAFAGKQACRPAGNAAGLLRRIVQHDRHSVRMVRLIPKHPSDVAHQRHCILILATAMRIDQRADAPDLDHRHRQQIHSGAPSRRTYRPGVVERGARIAGRLTRTSCGGRSSGSGWRCSDEVLPPHTMTSVGNFSSRCRPGRLGRSARGRVCRVFSRGRS